MRTFSGVLVILMLSISTIFVSGCLEAGSGTESGSTVVSDHDANPELNKITRAVCDPFQTNSTQSRENGLVGQLLYLTPDQPRYEATEDYMNHGQLANATLYLDRLFVPTRPSDRPFYMNNGQPIVSVDGTSIYKYFGVRMHSNLQLAANEAPGYYQLAVMSNDGAVLKVDDGQGGFKTIVNNDGPHPTQLACATEPIYLDHNTKLPMVMDYYQGNGAHISLITMWRPWPSDPDQVADHDSYCGRQGNGLFFNFDVNPVEPKKQFYETLLAGWKVLENQNYQFPEQTENPCAPTEAPLSILSFTLLNVQRDRITLSWTTNIPSTSQGFWKNTSSNTTGTTQVNGNLVTAHSLTITGLSPNTLYSIKAISTTPGGQSTTSDERVFKTLR